MIEAVLAHRDVSHERTHDIAYLLKLLDGACIPKPDNAASLPNLSPWAAELRYARQPEAGAGPSGNALVSRADQGMGGNSAGWPLR
jgi:hypothetical protein